MFDYIKGEITELTPTYMVIETGGIGYFIHITLSTYTSLNGEKTTKIYVYEVIREDAHTLYGFLHPTERQLFLLLISVSGIGANTGRMIMSSYSADEIQQMIASGNVAALNSIKGIGTKTAQRIIVDLKDKIIKLAITTDNTFSVINNHEIREEALAAMTMLGFTNTASQKVVDKILKDQPEIKVEYLIKLALKMM